LSWSIAHLAQAIPSPVPGPVATPRPGGPPGGGGSGPSIDLGPILSALNPEHLFGNFLLLLAQQLAAALATLWDGIWHSGANIFTYTAPALTYQFGPVAGLAAGMHLLIAGITAFAVVMAAASLTGRQVFGWGGDLGEYLGRVGLAATLANGAPFLISTAIDVNNRLCEAVGASSVARGFDGSPIFDNLTTGLLMLFVLWFGLQLGLKMLYRIGLLWILIVTAPLALACWAVPQAQWVATTWTRQFVGWTFGQVLVTIALKLGFENGPFGAGGSSEMGMLFSGVMVVLAIDLVDLLVYGSIPRFGVLRGASVVCRAAGAVGMTFVNAVPRAGALATQRRLPGF
jgi:hypothetical protein